MTNKMDLIHLPMLQVGSYIYIVVIKYYFTIYRWLFVWHEIAIEEKSTHPLANAILSGGFLLMIMVFMNSSWYL